MQSVGLAYRQAKGEPIDFVVPSDAPLALYLYVAYGPANRTKFQKMLAWK